MKFDDDGMVKIESISNVDQAIAFIMCLISKRNRHQKDIILIHKCIKEVCEMYPECKYLKGIK